MGILLLSGGLIRNMYSRITNFMILRENWADIRAENTLSMTIIMTSIVSGIIIAEKRHLLSIFSLLDLLYLKNYDIMIM